VLKLLLAAMLVAPSPSPLVAPSSMYGWTIDDVSGVSKIVASLQASPRRLTTRVVLDPGTTPGDYRPAARAMDPYTTLMGELVDSESMARMSVSAYRSRAASFVSGLPEVDVWEVANEANGDWTGTYASVSQKIEAAYQVVTQASKPAALTLWYNPDCRGSSRELDPVAFSQQYVSPSTRAGLAYVWVSYYETECNDYRPSAATLTALFTQLHQLYPGALLGFGEVGLTDPATASTLAKARSIMTYYYGLRIDVPGYVGGYFWWYGREDLVPTSRPLWSTFTAAVQSY
jgi:hypothetical protein